MSEPIILICAKSDGWTEAKVAKERRIQERVPGTQCTVASSDAPPGWRLTVTREYPDH